MLTADEKKVIRKAITSSITGKLLGGFGKNIINSFIDESERVSLLTDDQAREYIKSSQDKVNASLLTRKASLEAKLSEIESQLTKEG